MTKCCLGPWLKMTNFWRNPCPKLKSFLGKVYSLKSHIRRGLNETQPKAQFSDINCSILEVRTSTQSATIVSDNDPLIQQLCVTLAKRDLIAVLWVGDENKSLNYASLDNKYFKELISSTSSELKQIWRRHSANESFRNEWAMNLNETKVCMAFCL